MTISQKDKLENRCTKLARAYIVKLQKLINAAHQGKLNTNKNDCRYLFLGDVSDHIRTCQLIEQAKFKKAYDYVSFLDTGSREMFDGKIWDLLEKIAYPEIHI
jgi:hypothetical protein